MSDTTNMLSAYLTALRHFGERDLTAFPEEHSRLFDRARETGNHAEVIQSFYGMMGPLYSAAYGPNWHFVPPTYRGQPRNDAVRALHNRFADMTGHGSGRRLLDVGSGFGGAMRDVAEHSHGEVVGITMAETEVTESRRLAEEAGLSALCTTVQGDAQYLPFEDAEFDAALAVYALKYFPSLKQVFSEVHRVLKPGASFLIYDIVKTQAYDPSNSEHCEVVEGFEYACGMPSIHTTAEMISEAEGVGFRCRQQLELSGEFTWWHYFDTPIFRWMVFSGLVRRRLIPLLESLRVLPRGFTQVNDLFISGIIEALVRSGRSGILSASNVVLLEKPSVAPSPPEATAVS